MRKIIILPFIFLFVFGACDLTKLNKVTKSPASISGNPLFSEGEVALGNFIASVRFQTISEHWARTTYNLVINYEFGTYSVSDNVWDALYSDILINFKKSKNIIENNKALASGKKKNELASIQIMEVLAYFMSVNIFGNVPYSQALDPANPHPVFDDAQTIYKDLLNRLNTAINNLDPSAEGFGSADVIYQGDISKWIKFANSLKMRLGIMIADVNSSKAQKIIEAASPHAFTSNDDNAIIHYQSVPPNTNPVWEALVQSGRHDNLPSQPIIARMNKLNDPRRPVFFAIHGGVYSGGPYGETNNFSAYSHFSDRIKAKDRPIILLGYDEVEFIRAEAAARGYNIGGSAASHYTNGIRADMEYWEIPDSTINTYIAQSKVAYSSAPGDYRQKIGLQKWLALFTQGLQAWTSVRRLDAPDLKPSPHAVIDTYIKRFTYPPIEQNLNKANYEKAAQDIGGNKFTTRIFWDVK